MLQPKNLQIKLVRILALYLLVFVAHAESSSQDVECTLSKFTTNQLGVVSQITTTSKSFNLETMPHEILLTLASDPHFLQIFRPNRSSQLVLDFGRAEEEGLSHRAVATISGANEAMIERYVDVGQGLFYRGSCRLIRQPVPHGELTVSRLRCNTSAHATEGDVSIHKNAHWNSHLVITPFEEFKVSGNRSRNRNTNLDFFRNSDRFSTVYVKGVTDDFEIYVEQWPVEVGHRLIQLSCHQ